MHRRYGLGVSPVSVARMHRFRHEGNSVWVGGAVRPSGEIGDLSLGKWGRDSTLRGFGLCDRAVECGGGCLRAAIAAALNWGFFAGLALEALAEFFDHGVEAAAVAVGFGVAVDLEGGGKGVAADGGEGVVEVGLELGEGHGQGVDGFKQVYVALEFGDVEGAGQKVGVLDGDIEGFLHEGAAFVAHFGHGAFDFGGDVDDEGEFGADVVDRTHNFVAGLQGKGGANVVAGHGQMPPRGFLEGFPIANTKS